MAEIAGRLTAALADRYTLERELGHGGMATVYLARDLKHDRDVALKVLRPELAAVLGAERFLREIRLTARLQHPHILPLHDSGEAAGLLYYVMPFVEGESLRRRLVREGELPVRDAVAILREVASALAFAHRHGVIHRDIKPENILLAEGGAVVADFGVAKALAAVGDGEMEETLTVRGLVLGTPPYMAPEQAAGHREIDHRADLYALGLVAYEMLTGGPPFLARSLQAVLAAHASQSPEPVASRRPAVPRALAVLIMRLLEKRPADRPQSADEVLRELEDVRTASGGTEPAETTAIGVQARPEPAGARGGRRWQYARWAGLALLLLMLAAGLLVRARAARRAVTNTSKLLVVLPFENLGRSEDGYFADGITDEITNRLIGIRGLRVIARSSAREYKGTPKTLKQIGGELGVDYVLQGTVRWEQTGDSTSRVRVSPELIRVADRTSLWAHGYDAVLAGVFKVQSDIAVQVAGALDVALQVPERQALEARPTENLEAYQLYLQARERFFASDRRDDIRHAVDLYQAALRLDPRFVQAHAGLSQAHGLLYRVGDRTEARLALAKQEADEALRLDPESPDAHLALGAYDWYSGSRDYDRELHEYAIAQAWQPNNSDVLAAVGRTQRRQGKWAESFANLKRAADLDPHSIANNQGLAEVGLVTRNYSDVERAVARMIAFKPNQPEGYVYKAWLALSWPGDTAGASRALREGFGRADRLKLLSSLPAFVLDGDSALQADFARISPQENFYMDSGSYYAWRAGRELRLGNRNRARAAWDSLRLILEAEGKAQPDEGRYHSWLGLAYAGLGRKSEAIREGRKGLELVPLSRDAAEHPLRVFRLAQIYTIVGEPDAAIDQLEYLATIPSWFSANRIRVSPELAELRGDPRFQRLIRRMDQGEPRMQ